MARNVAWVLLSAGLKVKHSAPPVGDQLVLATWVLVAATALLFLATTIPAIAQFIEWTSRRKVRISELTPILHGIRTNLLSVRSSLIDLGPSPALEDVANVYVDADNARETAKQLDSFDGLSLDQRLELTVLGSHLNFLGLQLALITSADKVLRESVLREMDLEARLRKSVAEIDGALSSLDRLDKIFAWVRRRYKGRTYTEEMIFRVNQDNQEASRKLGRLWE